jgi:PncC family amidohydrolase
MMYMNYAIITHCAANNLTISAAESCTGGSFIASLIAVPGASSVIESSFVTYANDAKVQYAQVPQDLLDQHGAVSEETAIAMAKGVDKKRVHRSGLELRVLLDPLVEQKKNQSDLSIFVLLITKIRRPSNIIFPAIEHGFNNKLCKQLSPCCGSC